MGTVRFWLEDKDDYGLCSALSSRLNQSAVTWVLRDFVLSVSIFHGRTRVYIKVDIQSSLPSGRPNLRREATFYNRGPNITFSIRSIQASKSIPKSMKTQLIPSFLYSSCSSTNMWWLKNCCSFSLVKLMQSCSKPLYFYKHMRPT